MTRKTRLEVAETREEITDLQEDIAELEAELKEAAEEITQKWDDLMDDLETEELKPRRTDVDVQFVGLAWLPSWLLSYDVGGHTRSVAIPAYPQEEPA
jgi:hypothetical protein